MESCFWEQEPEVRHVFEVIARWMIDHLSKYRIMSLIRAAFASSTIRRSSLACGFLWLLEDLVTDE